MNGSRRVPSGTPHFQQNAPVVSTAAPQFLQTGFVSGGSIVGVSREPQWLQYGQDGWTWARHWGQSSGSSVIPRPRD